MAAKVCSICGVTAARYVCEDCGALICAVCFDPLGWRCTNCHQRSQAVGTAAKAVPSFETPLVIFLASFFIIFLGMVLMMISSMRSGNVSGSAVILLGPIPIIGGFGPSLEPLTLLALALTILVLIFFILSWRRR